MNDSLRALRALLGVALVLIAAPTRADSSGIDTVYHPAVQPLERDLEVRLTNASAGGRVDGQTWRIGYGQSLAERLFAEAYVIGQNRHGGDLQLEGYAFEALWHLTEQGQYAADWAVLGEFERGRHGDSHSGSVMLIGERQWGRMVGTLNASLGYEWGRAIRDEPETRLTLQGRYRWSPRLEPAVEFFAAEKLRALGPALLGTERIGPGRRLRWEFGLAVGLDRASPDLSARGKLEYEF